MPEFQSSGTKQNPSCGDILSPLFFTRDLLKRLEAGIAPKVRSVFPIDSIKTIRFYNCSLPVNVRSTNELLHTS